MLKGGQTEGQVLPAAAQPVSEHPAGMEWVYAAGKRSPAGEEIQRRENVAMFKSHMVRGGDSEQERAEEGSSQAR